MRRWTEILTDYHPRYLRRAEGRGYADTAGGGQGDEEAEEEGLGAVA